MVYSNKELRQIYDKNDGYCWHCSKKLAFTNYGNIGGKGAWEVDHSMPKSKGGTDYFRNLVPSCIKCNREKRDRHSTSFTPKTKRVQKDGCFIATAAYGSTMAPELYYLRKWRDLDLSSTHIGSFIIKKYYLLSPSIANLIRQSKVSKTIIRILLQPILIILKRRYLKFNNSEPLYIEEFGALNGK